MKLGTDVVQHAARVNRLRLALRLRPGLRFWLLCVILSVVLVLAIILSVALGAVSVPFTHVIRIIFGHLVSGTISWDQTEDLIIWDFRLPRVLLAAVVGAALAVSGTTLQALVRNPLGRVPIAPEELPAGIITAALGGPFFLWLLRTRAKGSKESENVS